MGRDRRAKFDVYLYSSVLYIKFWSHFITGKLDNILIFSNIEIIEFILKKKSHII